MKTYDELRVICQWSGRISEKVVADFQRLYSALPHLLGKKMEQQFDRFSHVGEQLGEEVMDMLRSQFLAQRVFRQDGLLENYLKDPELQQFRGEERDYLLHQVKLPWRFCFHVIVDEPAVDFYTIEDVFSGKQYLLFSPEVSNIRDSSSPVLWFNLI